MTENNPASATKKLAGTPIGASTPEKQIPHPAVKGNLENLTLG